MRLAILFGLVLTVHTALAGERAGVELVMFDQPYCEWCERWEEEIGIVYAKTDEGRTAPLRRVSIRDERPEGLEDIRGVAFTPTFVLVEDGVELGRINGYPGEDFFWPMLGQLLKKAAIPPATD